MKYRVDKRSNKELSILGMGCMRFPKNMEKTEELVCQSIEKGINYFDTAYIYPGNEETLGKILKKYQLREKIYIATKLPIMLIRNTKDFDKYFLKELERLQTNYIDYYLMHMITSYAQWKAMCKLGIREWIQSKKEEGSIHRIGFSFHGERGEFLKVLDAYDWEFCQIQYNYSDENYQAGVIGLKKAAEKEIPVIIMEPLLGGKLAWGLPTEAAKVLKKADAKKSPAEWALRWLWNQPEVSVVLSGMDAMEQLEENVRIASEIEAGEMSGEEQQTIEEVRDIFRKSNKIPCTGCGYCQPCPKNVNIPACFAAYNASFALDKKTGFHQYVTSTGPFAEQESRASLCVNCHKCEHHCPQNIKISEELKIVKKKMEPLWYYIGIKVARVLLRKNKKQT